jgi:hypothetical protein
MRIPRKLKKKFKVIWFKRWNTKHKIIKKTIEKKIWGDSIKEEWGCITIKQKTK